MPDPKCIYIEDISEDESVCKKGFPADITCWTGKECNCHYYDPFGETIEDKGG